MKIELVGNWKEMYKMYSIWAMAVLGSIGDIYNILLQAGLLEGTALPETYVRIMNAVAVAGVIARLIKQRALDLQKSGALDVTETV